MCHHPSRFSEDCVDFNMHEEKEEPKKETGIEEKKLHDSLEEAAEEYAEKHGFRVPYDGSNNFYDDVDVKASKDAFIAGATWQEEQDLAEMAQSASPLSVAYANRCFENGKQAMKKQMLDAAPRWISVDEKLPEMDEEVIVLTDELGTTPIYKISFGHIVNIERCIDYNGWNIPGVKYWMPCPEIPNE